MAYLILGFLALALGLLAMRKFANANPAHVARRLQLIGGVVVLLVAGLLFVRGLLPVAIPLAMFGSWLLWGTTSGPFGAGNANKSPGQISRVVTEHLEMELDHDTGEMRGRVLKGLFRDRDIESLTPADMALLWQDCRNVDPQSAQLIEAYLDRAHPSWREDMARGEEDMSGGPDGRMTLEEAYEILGLKPGASEEAIRRAHRELMLKLHPDRGGSTYLAAKINEAKDVAPAPPVPVQICASNLHRVRFPRLHPTVATAPCPLLPLPPHACVRPRPEELAPPARPRPPRGPLALPPRRR